MRCFPLFFALLLVFASCEHRPEGVLSKGKMKKVLYDYHLAQCMADEAKGSARDSSRLYVEAVWEKHHITEAQFDSSMQWYNLHNEDLLDIYTYLSKRFAEESEELSLQTNGGAIATFISSGGDTTNLWTASPTLLLRAGDGFNIETFRVAADSSFHPSDKFVLSANVTFLSAADRRSRDARLTIALAMHDTLGKTFSKTRQLVQPSDISLEVKSALQNPISELTGFFYFNAAVSERNLCLVDNIQLIRMHVPVQEEVVEEPIVEPARTDSAEMDTTPALPEGGRRLTPNQLHDATTTDKAPTRIKKAPDVRTPNSVGPTRRKVKREE